MNKDEIITYFNEMLSRLEAQFYHEIAGTAVKKLDLVGIDLLESKNIEGSNASDVIDNCIKELIEMEIVKNIDYGIHGHDILLKLEVDGCIHMEKEAMLKKDGIKPYMCPIANMIGDRILEILNYEATYMADLDIDENNGRCVIKYAIFENAGKIGQVSDWTKI